MQGNFGWANNMKKTLACALAFGGFAATAQAADLSADSLKDPLPDTISYAGVTFYGTVDVGYGYQTHATPYSPTMYTGQAYILQKNGNGAISSLTNNGMSNSNFGVKIEEGIGGGFVAIGKLDGGFNPLSGELSNACESLVQNNGKALTQLNTAIDGGRCGQLFNNEAYGGLSSATYGTLTIGRQNSLVNGAIATYDPYGGAYAFSLIGMSGGALGGIGDTETTRWDNSIKYAYQFGPVHAAAMYADGENDTSIWGSAYAGNVGVSYKGFSIDGFYEKENGAVGAASLSSAQITPVYVTTCNTATPPVCTTKLKSGTGLNAQDLSATITNNENWTVMGKYTFEFGGGFKDEGPSSKLTFFGGYAHIDMTNPGNTYANNNGTIGGYMFAAVNTAPYAFGATKTLETEWAGAAYETGPWTFSGAYYHEGQGDYTNSKNQTCAEANVAAKGVTQSNCSGDLDVGSFVVDYRFNKHFDVYSGVMFSTAGDGLASGFLNTDNTSAVTGLRLKF